MSRAVSNINNSDSIGYYHNKILKEIFTDSLTFTSFAALNDTAKYEYLIQKISQNVYNERYLTENILDTRSFIKLSQLINTSIEDSNSFDEFYSKLLATKAIDKSLLAVLYEYMKGLSETDNEEDVETYVNDMLSIVNQSKLDGTIKDSIDNGFKVGVASDQLWNKEISVIQTEKTNE